MLGGGTGPAHRHQRHHLHAGPLAHRPHDPGRRRLPDEPRLRRQGQRLAARRRWRSRSRPAPCGLKLHEDWGTTPAAIDCCLDGRRRPRRPGDDPHRHAERDRASSRTPSPRSRAARSTPTTPRAPAAATRPTSSRSAASRTCCRRSTNPTRPYTVNTLDEHLDMLMVCHHLDPTIPEDVAFAESRIRKRDHRRRGHPARPGRLLA